MDGFYLDASVQDYENEAAGYQEILDRLNAGEPESYPGERRECESMISGLGEMAHGAELAGCHRRDEDGVGYDRFGVPNPRCR